tara:strand:- start:18 stop:293 length:276 start_codon:yes stop_codon:yes gene_type:complete
MAKLVLRADGKHEKVELTQGEVNARNAEIASNEAKELADAPYKRLSEIDALLTAKAPRMLEDLIKGQTLDDGVIALIEEKDAIRSTFKGVK